MATRRKEPGAPPKLVAERVRLNRGGYDSRGRYYGTGEKLWRVTDTTGFGIDEHVRAPNGKAAKLQVFDNAFKALRLRVAGNPEPDQEDLEALESMVINIEGLDDSELKELAHSNGADARYRAIAKLYMQARPLRARGQIAQAMRLELQAQELYDRLPQYMQW